jgi:hypothetical protein
MDTERKEVKGRETASVISWAPKIEEALSITTFSLGLKIYYGIFRGVDE